MSEEKKSSLHSEAKRNKDAEGSLDLEHDQLLFPSKYDRRRKELNIADRTRQGQLHDSEAAPKLSGDMEFLASTYRGQIPLFQGAWTDGNVIQVIDGEHVESSAEHKEFKEKTDVKSDK